MSEFHFEDPDLKNSMFEMEFPSCVTENDNLMTLMETELAQKTRSLFKPKFRNHRHICVAVAVAVLVAKGPYDDAGFRAN